MERAQLLEGDEAVQIGLPGQVDHGHATTTHLAEDLVAADRLHHIRQRAPCPWDSVALSIALGLRPGQREALRPRSPHHLPEGARCLPRTPPWAGAGRRRRI